MDWNWIESLTLGVVQGLTEFLPISSDGHLTITQHAFEYASGRKSTAADKIFFDVMLHVGTLLAILVHYRRDGAEGAKGLLGSEAVPPAFRRSAVIRTGLLAIVATLPLIPDKLFFMDAIEKAFESLTFTGVGFLITAAILLVTLRLKGGEKGPRESTFLDALLVGVAQMFAPLPGVSRSGLTISAALALGFSRTWAVGFSLLMAVLAITGATVFELRKINPATLSGDRVAQIVASAALAGVIGYLAITWLVRLVRSGRIWYFSVYLVVLGVAMIAVDQFKGGRADVRPAHAVDRPDRVGPPTPGDRAGLALGAGPLAGPVADGPGTGGRGPGPLGRGAGAGPGLVLGAGLDGHDRRSP